MTFIQRDPVALSNEHLLALGKSLNLSPLVVKFIELSEEPEYINNQISYRELVVTLLEAVQDSRSNNSLNRKIKELDLSYPHAALTNLEFTRRDGLTKPQAKELCSLSWIDLKLNAVVTGCAGIGKTYVCDCLAICALRKGIKVCRLNCRSLLRNLPYLTTSEFNELKGTMCRSGLVYLDGFAQGRLTEENSDLFCALIEEITKEHISVLINSQLPPSQWSDYIGDPLQSGSLIDQLCPHNAIKINLVGESLRGSLNAGNPPADFGPANGTNGTQGLGGSAGQNPQMPDGKPFDRGGAEYRQGYHGTSTSNGTSIGSTCGSPLEDENFDEDAQHAQEE